MEHNLQSIARAFSVVSDTPRLDAELLIAAVLQCSRAQVLADTKPSLTRTQQQQLEHFIARRLNHEPMAYILGQKEFWGLTLTVTPAVLTPRPETEHLVEWILTRFSENESLQVADLGTGSGAIALALASERPTWRIDATDQSEAALAVARCNAAHHQLSHIHFYNGHWCEALPAKRYDVIVSNPPYIADSDPHLSQLTHEPLSALTAGCDGLDALREIIMQSRKYLVESGHLILEHGYDQAAPVTQLLQQHGFTDIQTHRDFSNHPRFATAINNYFF
jgi:release factor glutamine methyltransferase